MLRASITAVSRLRLNAYDATALRPAACRASSFFSSPRALHSSSTTASAASQSADPAAATAAAASGPAPTAGDSIHNSNSGARASIPRPRAVGEKHQILDEMLRVDHAGEYGAVRIYEGQISVLGRSPIGSQLRDMREHEVVHLDNLQRVMPERRVRPTAMLPLWHVAGYALGAGTALLGERAAMACTVAVEEVITEHYNSQLRVLHERADTKDEEALRQMIAKHRDEELEHREIGLKNDAENAPFYSALTSAIKAGCHAAIWLSKRV